MQLQLLLCTCLPGAFAAPQRVLSKDDSGLHQVAWPPVRLCCNLNAGVVEERDILLIGGDQRTLLNEPAGWKKVYSILPLNGPIASP